MNLDSLTLKKALTMQGPVLVGVPVDYRDLSRLTRIEVPDSEVEPRS